MRQIILDTETTGLQTTDGHRIIEIGCIELINRKFTGKRFHQYINPEREIEMGAQQVHGITTQFLQDKPIFSAIVDEFMEFISGAELVIHNAPFDVGFINYELTLSKSKWKKVSSHCRVLDTLVLARKLHVGQRNSLDALCKRYFIDNTQRELHGALLDAHLLAQVYLAMTGGQGSLFDESQATDILVESPENKTVEVVQTVQARKLITLNASSDELALHEKYLEMIAKKGKCVWLES